MDKVRCVHEEARVVLVEPGVLRFGATFAAWTGAVGIMQGSSYGSALNR